MYATKVLGQTGRRKPEKRAWISEGIIYLLTWLRVHWYFKCLAYHKGGGGGDTFAS